MERLGALAVAILFTFSSHAAPPVAAIRAEAAAVYEDCFAAYTHLHANPELSYQEAETSAYLAEKLQGLGYAVTEGVGGYGVVALLKNGDGPTVMYRADMDALPVEEETGLPYASEATAIDDSGQEVKVMHACGHDIHMTCLLGTAKVMAALKDEWQGTLMLILQPAEERGGGAKAMLADGLFERFPRPDHAIALHVSPILEAGKVEFISGYGAANVDSVDITVRGVGGHGAYPHMTKDPVVLAAQIVLGLQTIASREINPTEPVVVTVGSIHGGTKHNVIPNEVHLQLTVRSYTDEVRERTLAAIERVAVNTAQAADVPEALLPVVEVKDEYTPALYNNPALVERLKAAAATVLGDGNVGDGVAKMGGEDFGRYEREEPLVPICMMGLGSIAPERAAATADLPSLHSSRYYPDPEPTITTGVEAMSAMALALFE